MDDSVDLSEAELKHWEHLMTTPRRWLPLFRRLGGVDIIEMRFSDFQPDIPPHRRILIWVLQLALKDRATEVHFEPWLIQCEGETESRPGMRMFYKVNDQLEELVPPPDMLAAALSRDIEAVAGFQAPPGDAGRSG